MTRFPNRDPEHGMEPKTAGTRVDLPSLSLRAAFSPESLDEGKRTIELIWTTGARVLRGFFDQFWEELSLDPEHVRMERLNNGAPLLDAHNGSELGGVIGVVESARLQKGRGVATVRFARAEDDPNADAIWRKVRDGIIRNVSVGYQIHRMEKVSEEEGKIPVFRAVDWTPYEISMVPMGADAGAAVRAAGAATNPCVFVTRQESKTMANETDPTTTTPPALAAAEAATRAASSARIEEAKARAAESQASAEAATAAERVRSVEIRKIAQMARMGDEWALKLIEAGTTVEVARDLGFKELAARDQPEIYGQLPADGYRVKAGDDQGAKFVRGAAAWLFESAGVRFLVERAAKEHPEKFKGITFDPGEFRGMKLYELARQSLERQGVKTRGMDQMAMVGLAFTHRSNYQTVGDFPVLLETTMNKTLLAAYAMQDDTWSRFCRIETLPDFRPGGRYRTGSLTVLDIVPEHAEFKNKAIPDGQKLALTLQTYGNIVGLTRQVIINDDLGALTDMAVKLGRAAKLTIESAVYALLNANAGLGPTQTDAQPFFHANRANVNSVASALTAAGIDADRQIMALQKDLNNIDYIDLRPAILLVGAGQAATARVLNGAPFDPLANMLQKPNPVQGLFRDIIDSPRISGTRRYLLADPSIAPIIAVAFLEGQGQAPTVESQDGWRIDGVEWKVRLDAKAQMFDPKGGVTNIGV